MSVGKRDQGIEDAAVPVLYAQPCDARGDLVFHANLLECPGAGQSGHGAPVHSS